MTQPDLALLPVGARRAGSAAGARGRNRSGDHPAHHPHLRQRHRAAAERPFWPADSQKIAGIARGDVVQVIGTIAAYRDRRQLAVDSIRVLPRGPGGLARAAALDRRRRPLVEAARRLARPRHRATTGPHPGPVLRRPGLPGAATNGAPRAPPGITPSSVACSSTPVEVAHIGLAIARLYPQADADLVLAGILLHDIGKLESYRWDGVFEMTVPGAVDRPRGAGRPHAGPPGAVRDPAALHRGGAAAAAAPGALASRQARVRRAGDAR